MAERVQALLARQKELLGDISHELRSPLARLNVSLELVRRGGDGAVERMQADLDHVDVLIGQILMLTRLEAVGRAKAVTIVNLRTIVEGVAEDAQFEGQAEGKSVEITHADDCWLAGDPDLLRSSIENVVRNAVHYTEPQTSVTIALNLLGSGNSREAQLLIGDRGQGVPDDSLPRLFEPFYRVSASRERKTGGSGLGLSIAHRIVALHGGSIAARNRETGGLEMEIRLLFCSDIAPATLESRFA
jgi:two-component system sensor histidine kinase CpxA